MQPAAPLLKEIKSWQVENWGRWTLKIDIPFSSLPVRGNKAIEYMYNKPQRGTTLKPTDNTDAMNHKADGTQLWKILAGTRTSRSNPSQFTMPYTTPPKQHCDNLNNHYSKIHHNPARILNRHMTKILRKLLLDAPNSPFPSHLLHSTQKNPTKHWKKTTHARGLDTIPVHHLTPLGPIAINALTATP